MSDFEKNASQIGEETIKAVEELAESYVEDLKEAKEQARMLASEYVAMMSVTASAKAVGQDTEMAEKALKAAFANLQATLRMEGAAKVRQVAVDGLTQAAKVVLSILAIL